MIELLIVVAIIAIAVAIGAPNYYATVNRNRLTSTVNELTSNLALARSAAMKERNSVVIRPKGGGWEDGWEVFVDLDNDRVYDASETRIAARGPLPSALYVPGSRSFISYSTTGRLNHTGATFIFCAITGALDKGQDPRFARAITLSASGRSRMSRDTDGDGIHEAQIRVPLSCAKPGS